jgi:hypothetical protein
LAGALPGSNHIIHLEWTLPDSLASAPHCRVLRREQHEFRSTERYKVPVARDTYGGQPAAFAVTDTLPAPGYYLYQIVADASPDGTQAPVLLRQQWVAFSQLNPLTQRLADEPHLQLPLQKYPTKSSLSVVISDPTSGRVLLARQLVVQARSDQQDWVPASQWLEQGLQQVAVAITCHPPHGHFFTDNLLLKLPPQPALR